MDSIGRLFLDSTGPRCTDLIILFWYTYCRSSPLKRGLEPVLWKVAAGVDLEATFFWSSLSTSVFIFVLLQLNKGGTSLLTSLVLDLREALGRIARGPI